jgi:hypothetical protein
MNRYHEHPPGRPMRGGPSVGQHVRPSLDDPTWADAEDAVVELRRALDAVGARADFVGLRVVRNVVGRPVVQVGTVEADVARTLARQIRTATQQTPRADWSPTPVWLPSLRPPVRPATVPKAAAPREEPRPELATRATHPHAQQSRAVDAIGLRPALMAGPRESGASPCPATDQDHGVRGRAPASEDL